MLLKKVSSGLLYSLLGAFTSDNDISKNTQEQNHTEMVRISFLFLKYTWVALETELKQRKPNTQKKT